MATLEEERNKHRVIGIRHVLKIQKEAGLVEEESLYAAKAVDDIYKRLLQKAESWYKTGLKRGMLTAIEAFQNGDLEIDGGENMDCIANVESLTVNRTLNVSLGSVTKNIEVQLSIDVKDLGFENEK